MTTATADEFDTHSFVKNMTRVGMPEGQAETLAEYLRQHHRRMAARECPADGEYPGVLRARARADAQWRIIKTAGGITLGLLYLTWFMMWLVG